MPSERLSDEKLAEIMGEIDGRGPRGYRIPDLDAVYKGLWELMELRTAPRPTGGLDALREARDEEIAMRVRSLVAFAAKEDGSKEFYRGTVRGWLAELDALLSPSSEDVGRHGIDNPEVAA